MAQRISYIIGFASYLALFSFLGWSDTFVFSQLPAESVVSAQTYSLVKSLFNTGAYVIAAIWGATAVIDKRASGFFLAGALVLIFVGVVVTSVSAIYPFWLPIMLAAATIGVGQAQLFLVWQLVFAYLDSDRPYVLPAFATGFGALLYLCIVSVSPEQILELVSIVLIPAIGVFYLICVKVPQNETSGGSEQNNPGEESRGFLKRSASRTETEVSSRILSPLSASLKQSLLVSLLVFMCIAFMWTMMRSYSSGPSITSDTLTVIGRFASAVLVLLVFHFARRSVTVLSLFQYAFPVLAIGFILLPVFNSVECNIVVSVVAYTIHSMISIVAMVECRQLYLTQGISPITSAGIAWAGVGLSMFFGRSIGAVSVEFNFIITLVFIVMYVLFQVLFSRMGKQDQAIVGGVIGGGTGVGEGDAGEIVVGGIPVSKAASTTEEQSNLSRFSERYGFTQREEEVFALLLKGRTSKQIADRLFVSNNTVLTHLKSIYRKTNVHSKTQIVDLFETETEEGSL